MLANHQLPVNNFIYLMNMVFYKMISATLNYKLNVFERMSTQR